MSVSRTSPFLLSNMQGFAEITVQYPNVIMRCLQQRYVLNIMMVTTDGKEVYQNAKRKYKN
ncbi:hypothetical protein D3Z36_15330 [Lachnospiraceae bacterium]|nr:hypothetical protein [Lachnospiraceae bacterium]